MNKQELKFLMKLNEHIDKGCKILDTERAGFMPGLDRALKMVSLGMELGLAMKGKAQPKVKEVKAKNKVKAKVESPVQKERALKVVAAAVALLKKTPELRLIEIAKAAKIVKITKGLSGPQQAVWRVLHDSSEIESVPNKRGFYRLVKSNGKSKQSSNDVSTAAVAN